MKVFISADIEGVTGTTHWDETIKEKNDHAQYALQMTKEVNAACEAINDLGESDIYIKDAHDSGRNINHSLLPINTKLIRDWESGLLSMVQELDSSFDALVFIGYHSPAGSNFNPLAHTLSGIYNYIKINGEKISEYHIYSYASAYYKVPIVFLSGDAGMCDIAKELVPDLETVTVKEGNGGSTINIHPELALLKIKEGVKKGLLNKEKCILELPESFEILINYKDHIKAHKASHYPGASLVSPHEVKYVSKDYIEVLRLFMFV